MNVGLWRDDRHRYYASYPDRDDANGLAMPGVTGVLRTISKPALVPWAKGVTADAALDNIGRLQEMLASDGRAPTKAWLTAHAEAVSDKAKDLGSRVHVLAEQIERGASPDMDDDAVPYVEAYRRWREEAQPQFKSLEQFTCNLKLGYGGTFDFLAVIDGKMTLGDTKTGKGIYPETRLQLAALGMAEFIGRPNDPKRYRMPQIEQYVVLHVRPEAYAKGFQLYRVNVNEADREAFRGALSIYRWAEQRPSKGEPYAPAGLEAAA